MKSSRMLALVAMCALSAPLVAQQADSSAPPPPPPMHEGGGGHWQMEHMARELNLARDQKMQVRAIMRASHTKGDQIRSNTALSDQDRRDQMKANMESTRAQIRAVLNDDQKQKFDQMVAERREHGMNRRGPGGPPPGDQPPPPPQQ